MLSPTMQIIDAIEPAKPSTYTFFVHDNLFKELYILNPAKTDPPPEFI